MRTADASPVTGRIADERPNGRPFGTDLSVEAVDRARAGLYLSNVAQDVPEGRLARFFQESSGGYQIRRDPRDLCVFARHDVTRDPPFSDMDIIICRNLLIYLDVALQSRVLQVFHYALYDLGLAAALGSLAERFATRQGLRVTVTGDVGPLDHDIAAALYRVALELLTNTVKHARCGEATVTLARDGGEVSLVVADGGAGFDPGVINGGDGFGLFGVRERVRTLGGSVEVNASPGGGCRVTVRAPARLPEGLAGAAP